MRSRALQKRIEIWQSTPVPDGFGGNNIYDALIDKYWANITTLSDNRKYSVNSKELGINDIANSIVIKLRKRNDLPLNSVNQFIKYRGHKYIIQTQPTNTNFDDAFIELIATREQVSAIEPVLSTLSVYPNYVATTTYKGGITTDDAFLRDYISTITCE